MTGGGALRVLPVKEGEPPHLLFFGMCVPLSGGGDFR